MKLDEIDLTACGDNIIIPTELLESPYFIDEGMDNTDCKIYVTEGAKASYQDREYIVAR